MISKPWMARLPETLILDLAWVSLTLSFVEIEVGGLSAQPHPFVLSI